MKLAFWKKDSLTLEQAFDKLEKEFNEYKRTHKSDSFVDAINSINQGLANDNTIDINTHEIHPRVAWMLVRSDKILRKCIEKPVQFQLKDGFKFEDEPGNETIKYYNQLGFRKHISKFLTTDRIAGTALLVLNIEDGKSKEEPLDKNNIKEIHDCKIYEKYEIAVQPGDTYKDVFNSSYGKPEVYTIYPTGGTQYRIHESRCYLLEGEEISEGDKLRYYNLGGDSAFSGSLRYIQNFWNASGSAGKILSSYVQLIMTIEGLQDQIANKRSHLLKERMRLIEYGVKMNNVIPMDSNEKFERKSSSVSGTSDLIASTEQQLSTVFSIPYSILFEKSRGGLNKSDDEINNWYDTIEWLQENKAYGAIKFVCDIIRASKAYNTVKEPCFPEFNSLERLTFKEEKECQKIQSEIDINYEGIDVVASGEIRQSRYSKKSYSFDTQIDEKNNSKLDREKVEPVE